MFFCTHFWYVSGDFWSDLFLIFTSVMVFGKLWFLDVYLISCSGENISRRSEYLSCSNFNNIFFFIGMKVSLWITLLSIGETRHISIFFLSSTPKFLEVTHLLSIYEYYKRSSSADKRRIFSFKRFLMWAIGGYLYISVSYLTF